MSYIPFERTLGLWEYIPKSIPSVCTYHDLQTNSWTSFFIIKLWCYTSMDLSQRALQTNELFFKFRTHFRILTQKLKIFKRIARREYWSKCIVLYINGFVSTSSTNCWKLFSNFEFVFELLAKTENYSNEWQGVKKIKFQCVIYQWIHLDKLFKLMESFFKFQNHFQLTTIF